MKTDLERLAADVAALLGEPLITECETEESPFPGFTARVGRMATGVLTQMLRESPRALLTGWLPLAGALTTSNDGIPSIPLPEDFLMLGGIKLSHWQRGTDTVISPDHKLASRQYSSWEGIRGNPQRPVALIAIGNGGKRILRLIGGACEAPVLDYGWYMPVPEINDGTIEIPPALYPQLVEQIAGALTAEGA